MTYKDKFTKEILAEVDQLLLSDTLFEGREEVIGLTIDGETSKDLDDAIYVEPLEEGYNVQVSIADVGALVKISSAIYKEALNRIATQYRKSYNIPMLPPELSEDRLSLLPGERRPTITFHLQLSASLDVETFNIQETYISSKRQLYYAQVEEIVNTLPDDPDYELLVHCNNLAEQLLERRRNRGAIAIYDLNQHLFTNEEGQILPLSPDRANRGNLIVQELMILINQATATYFAKQDIPFLFRNHTVRQNSPEREEMIAQFNAAILNPNLVTALGQRVDLWFDRANYEPILKGHYGLNEAAYTHVTSPIRRLPDMLNHQIIKAFLANQEQPYPSDSLIQLSEHINEKLAQIKEERAEYFKEKAIARAQRQALHSQTETLINMETNGFRQVLKQVCRTGIMGEEFEHALMARFDLNHIDVSHLYIIFFEMVGDGGVWSRIRERALVYANDNPGYNSQLLNLQTQKGNLSRYEVEIKQGSEGYLARIVASSNAGYFSTPVYAHGASKKDAQHLASYNFLVGYLEHSLVPPHETKEPAHASIISALESLGGGKKNGDGQNENYVGQLNELCARKGGWAMPTYQFQKTGPSHQPLITCECILETGVDESITASGIGTNKKVAKQVAARNILEIIVRDGIQFQELPETASQPKKDSNFVGRLNEMCQRNRWGLPTYDFNQAGPSHNPTFDCIVTVEPVEGTVNITGTGSSKKIAKQEAAKTCITTLEEMGYSAEPPVIETEEVDIEAPPANAEVIEDTIHIISVEEETV